MDTAWRPGKIFKDMRKAFVRKEAPNPNPHATFKVKTLYSDDGRKLKRVFKELCIHNNIRQILFKPSTGKKTKLNVVKKFNRTFRRYYEIYVKTLLGTSGKLSLLIPEIFKE